MILIPRLATATRMQDSGHSSIPEPDMRNAITIAAAIGLLIVAGCKPSGTADEATSAPTTEPASSVETAPMIEGDTATITTSFQCGDLLIDGTFDSAAETATLAWPDQQLVLTQVVSASGAHYTDANGNEFWNKGSEATLTLAGDAAIQCTAVADDTD